MQPAAFIAQKRDGESHASADIADWIRGYVAGDIPDYQMSAWAMAVYLQGMSREETAVLTDSMLRSGCRLQWPDDGRAVVDKHSTGGVGDKVSLVLAPLLACCELRVPMISGRGLGPTGGTLDKLESIAGFRTQLSTERVQQVTAQAGCVIAGASQEIAPADKQLYALRDVTATVASTPLITASIMAKKLAEGLDALVLDVKCGSGAFMKTLPSARQLAESLVQTGAAMQVDTVALLTDMNQPLGRWIGNAVEVDEAVAALSGGGPQDLRELTIALGAELLVQCGRCPSTEDAATELAQKLDNGQALQRLARMVQLQGGDLDVPRATAPQRPVTAERAGFVTAIDAEQLGWALIELGGGRRAKGDPLDHAVGIAMECRLGDAIESGQPLATLAAHESAAAERAAAMIRSAFTLGENSPNAAPLIVERITA